MRVLFALAFASALGCGAAPSRRDAPTTPPPPPPAPVDPIASGASFTTIASARFDLSLPLPGGASFRVDDRSERWFVATHSSTNSTLLVRTWREDAVVNRERCEARARTWRALPEREGSRLIESRRVAVPEDHDTVAEVRLGPRAPVVTGFVLAFGGWAKRCFAYVFVTKDEDPRVVTDRLATMMDGSLARTKVRSELVAPREPRAR